jgi:hypothetical protein
VVLCPALDCCGSSSLNNAHNGGCHAFVHSEAVSPIVHHVITPLPVGVQVHWSNRAPINYAPHLIAAGTQQELQQPQQQQSQEQFNNVLKAVADTRKRVKDVSDELCGVLAQRQLQLWQHQESVGCSLGQQLQQVLDQQGQLMMQLGCGPRPRPPPIQPTLERLQAEAEAREAAKRGSDEQAAEAASAPCKKDKIAVAVASDVAADAAAASVMTDAPEVSHVERDSPGVPLTTAPEIL